MAIVFYVFGWLAIIGGGWVVAAAFRSVVDVGANADQYARAGAGLAFVAVGAPGLAVFFGGLLLLGIGCIVARLDRLVRNSSYDVEAYSSPRRVEPR